MNSTKGKRTITYREAVKEAIREALQRDSRVFLMGEDVGHYGGCYAVSKGLLDEFGPERIRDTPLCESGFVGAGIGAALGGMRPIVEVMTVNFSLLALDQIVNTAATLLHMSGGQCNVPLVIRMATGARMKNILQQFLIEALVVSALGGVIGVALGLASAALIERFGTAVQYSLAPVVLAFSCAFLTGLVFGYLPARKAARLDPVAALASE